MRANIPRQLASLSKADRRKLAQEMDDAFNRDVMIVLDIWLKMSATVLHDAFGFGEDRLTRYLANYRRTFKKHMRLVKAGQQIEHLDMRMKQIFRKKGYPDEFFKEMFEDWTVNTNIKE